MLLLEDPCSEALGSVVVLDRHGGLQDDWTRVQLWGHDVHRGAGYLRPVLERLGLTVHPWKRRQERWVDIENPVRKSVDEHWAQEPHEASQTHQIDLVSAKSLDEGDVVGLPRVIGRVLEHGGLDARRRGTLESTSVRLVGHDDCNRRVQSAVGHCVDDGLEVATPPRNQHAQSASHGLRT